MSVSRGCVEVEREPGKWYCIVAQDEYDYDFQGNYSVYGPKPTAEEAFDEMYKHEANPGSDSTVAHDQLTPHWTALVDEELARQKQFKRPWR